MATEKPKQIRWLRIVLYVVVLGGIGVAFFLLFPYLMRYFNIPIEDLASTAYLAVFGITLLCNAAVLVPVVYPHLTVMIAAAGYWNPFVVALVASAGGALGEMTGYYAGYLGKRIVDLEKPPGYDRLGSWMGGHGFWGLLRDTS